MADADIKIVNPDGGVLDVSSIELPSDCNLEQLQEKTGRLLSYSQNNGLKVSDTGTLTLDTLIDIKGVSKPLSEVVADMKPGDKVRCETPFRASSVGGRTYPHYSTTGCRCCTTLAPARTTSCLRVMKRVCGTEILEVCPPPSLMGLQVLSCLKG